MILELLWLACITPRRVRVLLSRIAPFGAGNVGVRRPRRIPGPWHSLVAGARSEPRVEVRETQAAEASDARVHDPRAVLPVREFRATGRLLEALRRRVSARRPSRWAPSGTRRSACVIRNTSAPVSRHGCRRAGGNEAAATVGARSAE